MEPTPTSIPPENGTVELTAFRLPFGIGVMLAMAMTIVFCIWYGHFWRTLQLKKKQQAQLREALVVSNERVDGTTTAYTSNVYLIDISDRVGSQNRRTQANTVIIDSSPPAYYISPEWSASRNINEDYLMDIIRN